MQWFDLLLTALMVLALWTLAGIPVGLLMGWWLRGKGVSQWD